MDCEFSEVLETSREEEAELTRSTKKVKENPATSLAGDFPTGSYKDRLVGEIPGAFLHAFGLNPSSTVLGEIEEEKDEILEDVQEVIDGIANVKLSKNTKVRIRSKWTHSLIIKVFGRSSPGLPAYPFQHSIGVKNALSPVVVHNNNRHRKGNCPYSIKEPTQAPVEEVVVLEVDKDDELAGNIENDYGPWSIVQRRKSSRRLDNKKTFNSNKSKLTSSDILGCDRAHGSRSPSDNFSADTQERRHSEGKRKLQAESVSPAVSSGLQPITPNFSFVSTVTTPNLETQHLPKSFSSPQVSDSLNGKRSSSSKGKAKEHRNGFVKSASLGNPSQRKNNGSSSGDVGSHKGHPDCDSRVVRPRAHDSLEVHLPTNQGKPGPGLTPVLRSGVATVGKPLVGVLDGPTSTKTGENTSVEDATVKISGASLVRIKSLRGALRKENVSGTTDCCLLSGQQNTKEVDSSIPTKLTFQSK
ncbi:cytochrome p450 71d8 [Fagus crenata]